MLVGKAVKLQATGLFAWIALTVLPWGIGKGLFMLLEAINGCKDVHY